MRTAMLAAAEQQIEDLQKEALVKDDTVTEAMERVTTLQAKVGSSETRLAERVEEFNFKIAHLESTAKLQVRVFLTEA